jgi:hypothetical protein
MILSILKFLQVVLGLMTIGTGVTVPFGLLTGELLDK